MRRAPGRTSTLSGVRPMYSPSAQMGWSGSTSRLTSRAWRKCRDAPAVGNARKRSVAEMSVSRSPLFDQEAVEQAVLDRVGMGDPEPGAHHPRVDEVGLGSLDHGRLAIELHLVPEVLVVTPVLGHVHGVGEDTVLVLLLAARLLLGLHADVHALDEVAVGHLGLAHAHEPAHVDGAGVPARAQEHDGVAELAGSTDLPGEPVAGAARQDPHRHLAALVARGVDHRVGDLVLGAVTAVPGHQVHAVRDGGPGLLGGVAVLVGDADVPLDAVLAEHVVERVEDRLVLPGRRVDHHVNPRVRCVCHDLLLGTFLARSLRGWPATR